jgi:ribosomal protein L35
MTMTKDSISDRIKVTKTGKLIKRTMGLGHFRAKKSSRQIRRKTDSLVNPIDVKMFKKYL